MTKDSQDWLGEILDTENDKYWDSVAYSYYGSYGGYDPKVAEIKSAIREHFLKEALEIIGDMEGRETEDMSLQSWGKEDYEAFGRNILRLELRSKFNDKYKED